MRVDAKYASKHSRRWDGLWIGPFRVVLTANGGLEISVQHIGTGAVLTRHTRDLRCYFSDGDDDLPVEGEFVVREIAWETNEFDLWERLDHVSSELIMEAERKFAVLFQLFRSIWILFPVQWFRVFPLWFCHLQWWRRLWDVWFCRDWGVVRIRCGWTWGGGDFMFPRVWYSVHNSSCREPERGDRARGEDSTSLSRVELIYLWSFRWSGHVGTLF